MDWNSIFGYFLLVYGVICFYVAFTKPEWVWKTGKVRWFVKNFGEKGTVILLVVFGSAALIAGLLILL